MCCGRSWHWTSCHPGTTLVRMTKVACDLSISLDGFAAGHNQAEDRPFGDDGGDGWGSRLHAWFDDPAERARLYARSMSS